MNTDFEPLPEITPENREGILRKFRGGIDEKEQWRNEHWRNASPEEHASVLADLMDFAESVAKETGARKTDTFPGFPPLRIK